MHVTLMILATDSKRRIIHHAATALRCQDCTHIDPCGSQVKMANSNLASDIKRFYANVGVGLNLSNTVGSFEPHGHLTLPDF